MSDANAVPRTTQATASPLDVGAVYASQRDFVWLTLQRMGVRRADLEDVFQDVFMIVHRRLHTYRADAKLSAWLYGICLRCVARHRRRAFRRRESPEGVELEQRDSSPWQARVDAPDRHLDDAQRQERLNRLLDVLDPEHRAMVVMYEIEELGCAEISELTGVKLGTIHSRLHAARRKLVSAARRFKGEEGR
ncbi:MAG TPA: sigma-70 family RNA polymerase sigma factor [Polyangiaceae bacterium]|nr:sigma-70 family RNA polymerase sigma factor [Polyangiaceae bacterium]